MINLSSKKIFNYKFQSDRRKLAKKIGFALFQSPTEVPLEELEEAGIDIREYEDEQSDYKSKYGYSKKVSKCYFKLI